MRIYIGSEFLKPLMYYLTNADNNSDISVHRESILLKMLRQWQLYSLRLLDKVDLCTKLAVRSVFLACVRGQPLRMSELELNQLVARLKSDAECRRYGFGDLQS